MCELLGLSSNVPATVNVSLPTLAEHGRVSGTYNDGWGVGYYEGPDVRLMKDSAAVGDSEWIQFIANHNLRSQLVIAHTRKATRGTRSYPNAQPFVRELAGRAHLFAHNGDLPGIFKSSGFHADPGKIEAPGLVSVQRQCQHDTIGSAASGLSIRGDNQQVALFASVPLTNERWAPLAEGELVAACGGQLVARQLIDQALVVSDTFSDNPIVDTFGARSQTE